MERGRRLASLAKGWQLFRSTRLPAMAGREERKDRCESDGKCAPDKGEASAVTATASGPPVPLSGNPPLLRNALQCQRREVIRPNDPQDQQEESR